MRQKPEKLGRSQSQLIGSGDIGHSLECLPLKHEDQSSDPLVAHLQFQPTEGREKSYLEQARELDKPHWQAPGLTKKLCLNEQSIVPSKEIPDVNLRPPYSCTNTHVYQRTREHACIQACTPLIHRCDEKKFKEVLERKLATQKKERILSPSQYCLPGFLFVCFLLI